VMEDHTSLIGHSEKPSRKLELITGLPLHITLGRAVKQKHQTSIPNGLQNADQHDALSASLREDLSPSRRTWTQSFLGHQKVEHGPQGNWNKKENLDCQTWGMEGKGLTQCQAI
jgi:hypothetical protein